MDRCISTMRSIQRGRSCSIRRSANTGRALPDGSLVPAYAGIRPKIVPPAIAAQDFVIQGPRDHGVAGLINLFGIESPGLTSSLAIADHVGELADM